MPAEPRIASTEVLMDYLSVKNSEAKESLVKRYLLAAELTAERWARRWFSAGLDADRGEDVDYTVTFTTRGRSMVRVPGLRSVSSIALNGTPLGSDDFDLGWRTSPSHPSTMIDFADLGYSATARFASVSRIGSQGRNDLVITGRWGFKEVPSDVVHAVCIIAAKQWRRRDSGFADVAVDETTGNIKVAQAIPSEAEVILSAYRIPNVGVISVGDRT